MLVVIFWQQVALEREEILLELHEGRKAEEEAFKEQLEMEENIKRRLRLRLMSLCTNEISRPFTGRAINWPSNIGESERLKRRPKKNITGGRKCYLRASKEYICSHCRQLMLAKFAEDDKLEQMNAQKRRMK